MFNPVYSLFNMLFDKTYILPIRLHGNESRLNKFVLKFLGLLIPVKFEFISSQCHINDKKHSENPTFFSELHKTFVHKKMPMLIGRSAPTGEDKALFSCLKTNLKFKILQFKRLSILAKMNHDIIIII